MPRVLVTGMGTINPLGHSVAESWEKLINGVSGVGRLTLFDPDDQAVQIACEVKDFDAPQFMDAREARRRDRFEQFAVIAAQQAITQSGIEISESNAARVAVLISSAIGGFSTIENAVTLAWGGEARRMSPFTIPMFMPNGASSMVAIEIGARGPCLSLATACATGGDSLGVAMMLIRSGMADIAVAGAAEATITRTGIGAFDRIGALSRRSSAADPAPSPFDLERDGLVMGEGAAVLVLESESHARRRGASVLAELAGYGTTADAYHITAPAEQGEGGAAAIQQALQSAGLNAEDLGYINAHGTGTQLNDVSETRAIKTALGSRAYQVPVSSTKSMTGHMMGATPAFEALVCIQAIRENTLPPTINYRSPDPECDLDYIPNQARQAPVEAAISNAFGFGGHNAVLAFTRFSG